MTEKRYFKKEWEEGYYIFDSTKISEERVDELREYDYRIFADSMQGDEVVDLLNEQEERIKELEEENNQLKRKKERYKRLSEIRYENINNRILSLKEFINNCEDEKVKNTLKDLFYSEVKEYDLAKENRKLKRENEQLKQDLKFEKDLREIEIGRNMELQYENEQLKKEKDGLFLFFMDYYDQLENELIEIEIKLEERIKELEEENEKLKQRYDAQRDLYAQLDCVKNNLFDENEQEGTIQELYDFRLIYNALLFNEWSKHDTIEVYKSKKHSDGELCFDGEWFVVVAILPIGQITNHYHIKYWDYFQIKEYPQVKDEFDGHTPIDVLNRLKSMVMM